MLGTSTIRRSDIVCIAIVLFFLGCLLLPALAQSNSQSDRTLCLNKMKEIAVLLHLHHDARRTLPLASTQPIVHKPGSTNEDSSAGYSWLTQLTPYLHSQPASWFALTTSSTKLETPPFDSNLMAIGDGKEVHPATFSFGEFICPSYSNDTHVIEADSDYRLLKDGKLPAVATYYAFSGTHFFNTRGIGRLLPDDAIVRGAPHEGNGCIPFPWRVGGQLSTRGIGFAAISDGTSNTFAIAESIESAYAAWIDGQVMWLVAAWPGNDPIPMLQSVAGRSGVSFLGWNDADKKNSKVAIGLKNEDGSHTTYLVADRWSGSKDRRWAASSNHPGVVGHAFADGHAAMLSIAVDPNVYLHLTTRAGHELIAQEVQEQLSRRDLPSRVERRVAQPSPSSKGVELRPEQWSSIEWSPLAIGDLRLYLPQLLDFEDFRRDRGTQDILTYSGSSAVFRSLIYDRAKSEFRLRVRDEHAATAAARLYKQLRDAFDHPGTKDLKSRPKRVVWQKVANWQDGAATFEFVLIEASDDEPPSVAIRVIDLKDDSPQTP